MENRIPDFEGWATRNNVRCTDGRTILPDAFKHNDGKCVPLVWNHQHNDPLNVIGKAYLFNKPDGVYAHGYLNNTVTGRHVKECLAHGDYNALSIAACQLKHDANRGVMYGDITELSIVLAGANPKAFIETVIKHGQVFDDEAVIYFLTDEGIKLNHAESDEPNEEKPSEENTEEEVVEENDDLTHTESDQNDDASEPESNNDPSIEHNSESDDETDEIDDEESIQEILDTLDPKQKLAVAAVVNQILEHSDDNNEGGNETMKQNAFDKGTQKNAPYVLTHADQVEILNLAKQANVGSLRTAINIFAEDHSEELQHADLSGFVQTGEGNVSNMFPEYVEAHPSNIPEVITNDMGWVEAIMRKTQKIPHGRVRTSHVDIRNIDALKAKGHVKGGQKKITGNYALVRRTTDPQTVYVTSELHRDDVVDIEDFDYIKFQYNIDQMSLKETLAVATMLGDDRPDGDPEKIFPDKIRPIWTDDELYTIHKDVDFAAMAKELQGTDAAQYFGESFIYAEAMVTALRKARKDFRGTGKPDLFISPDMHSTMILARDRNGHRIYNTDIELAAALGVANIYEVTQFEDKIRTDADGAKHKLHAICVNMADYGYGASKGGDVTHFTDFDIKFNLLQSLLETRKSGQLTRIKSAIVIEEKVTEAVA